MNYRQKERAIDRYLWNVVETITLIAHPNGGAIFQTRKLIIDKKCKKICDELGYTEKQIHERYWRIQLFKKESRKPYMKNYRKCRYTGGTTIHRYYKTRNKKRQLDKPPHERTSYYSNNWSDSYVESLRKKKLEEESKRKFVKHSSEFRTSKLHLINKNYE